MRVVIDIETDKLINPEHIWVIVCHDIDSKINHIFRGVKDEESNRFLAFAGNVKLWIGHNLLGFDRPVLHRLLNDKDILPLSDCVDTLVLSKLIDYSRSGHSIENYGEEFGIPKGKFIDFSAYSQEMEDYCVRDCEICSRIYSKYRRYIDNPVHRSCIDTEHKFQCVVNSLHDNGFQFNTARAVQLRDRVEKELAELDGEILQAFPPKLKLVREIHPKETKYGTLSKTDFRWVVDGDLSVYNGGPFCRCSWIEFNPNSHKQIISVLNDAGWSPIDKTTTHVQVEREFNKLKHNKYRNEALDLRKKELSIQLDDLKRSGWKVNENNLDTLPSTAPKAAKLLAKRILLEARRRTLTEWLNLVWHEIEIEQGPLGILGIDANGTLILNGEIDNEKDVNSGVQTISKNLEPAIVSHILNCSMDCPQKTLLEWLKSKKVDVQSVKKNANSTSIIVIGQDQLENFCAEIATVTSDGLKNFPLKYKIISQRIHGNFYAIGAWSHRMAHQSPNTANIPNEYDTAGKKKLLGKELRSLWCAPKKRLLVGVDAEGIQLRIFAHYINDAEFTKELLNGDPHTLNQTILGEPCRSREAAKRFIYALLLGAGLGKLAEILGCDLKTAEDSLSRLLLRYEGFRKFKEEVIPKDAARGWFTGLDGRSVRIPGETIGQRKHLAMSGYLQNGEAVIMKRATLLWVDRLKEYDALLVNFVHDEWQVECPNNMTIALEIANMMSSSLEKVGQELNMNCPLSGSFWNKKRKDYTIDTNWSLTH